MGGLAIDCRTRPASGAFNIFGANVSDIDCSYPPRLTGEPAGGVEDFHTDPALPPSAPIGIQFSFFRKPPTPDRPSRFVGWPDHETLANLPKEGRFTQRLG
jgi:hypothetical protein